MTFFEIFYFFTNNIFFLYNFKSKLFVNNVNIILLSFLFLFLFVCFLLFISFLLSPKIKNIEKNSPYECGFNPFEDTRAVFEIHFYRIAILFIIFDSEIAFLLPWVVTYDILNFFGFYVISFFLLLLILGFIYELLSGALDWE
jgi:NADH-quinone oxidoreductase subunit A